MLKSIGDRWKESGAEDENFQMRVTSDSPYTSQGVFDVFEGDVKLRHSAIVLVELYTELVDTCMALLDQGGCLSAVR